MIGQLQPPLGPSHRPERRQRHARAVPGRPPETSLPSIPLTWSLPLHVEAGDGARLAELFARVWERIPTVGRQNLLLAWVEAGPRARGTVRLGRVRPLACTRSHLSEPLLEWLRKLRLLKPIGLRQVDVKHTLTSNSVIENTPADPRVRNDQDWRQASVGKGALDLIPGRGENGPEVVLYFSVPSGLVLKLNLGVAEY
jgi:hypothetical protein